MIVAPSEMEKINQVVVYCGSLALEFCIPYMATRVLLAERGQAVALVRILCIAIATIGVLGIIDEFSRRFFVREIVGSFTGYHVKSIDYSDLMRGFLFRSTSTLEHPILFGTACLFGLLLATTIAER